MGIVCQTVADLPDCITPNMEAFVPNWDVDLQTPHMTTADHEIGVAAFPDVFLMCFPCPFLQLSGSK